MRKKLTDGVIPSLHVDYKNSRIKQYFKRVPEIAEVGARTETTINHTRDFYIGRRLCNLAALRQVGFQANRRLLEVERLSHDCAVGEEAMQLPWKSTDNAPRRCAPSPGLTPASTGPPYPNSSPMVHRQTPGWHVNSPASRRESASASSVPTWPIET